MIYFPYSSLAKCDRNPLLISTDTPLIYRNINSLEQSSVYFSGIEGIPRTARAAGVKLLKGGSTLPPLMPFQQNSIISQSKAELSCTIRTGGELSRACYQVIEFSHHTRLLDATKILYVRVLLHHSENFTLHDRR